MFTFFPDGTYRHTNSTMAIILMDFCFVNSMHLKASWNSLFINNVELILPNPADIAAEWICREDLLFYKIYCTNLKNARYAPAPAKYPNKASGVIFRRYHIKSIFAMPIAATPAADPIMSALPPVPAQ